MFNEGLIMKFSNLITSLLCILFFAAPYGLSRGDAATEPIPLDKETVEKIAAAHQRLEENVNNVTGRTYHWNLEGKCDGTPFSKDGLQEGIRAKFYRRGESIRVEYSHKDAEGNDIEIDKDYARIFIYTPSVSYQYNRLPTTGPDPISNLREYATPSDADSNVRPMTESLVKTPLASLTHIMNKSVLELLQNPVTQWEKRPFHKAKDALWITCENPSAKGDLDIQQYQMVLSPSEDYAVLSYKIVSKIGDIQGEVRSVVLDEYGRVPQMIDQRRTSPKGSPNSEVFDNREVIELDYDPDRSFSSSLFKASSFEEDGGALSKITIRNGADVSDRTKEVPTSTPGSFVPPTPNGAQGVSARPAWPWWRYLATLCGLALIAAAMVQLWKKYRSLS